MRNFKLLILLLVLGCNTKNLKTEIPVAPGFYQKKVELSKFASDGCTLFSNGSKKEPEAWNSCCIEHDVKYWLGGTREDRHKADAELLSCVKSKDYPLSAFIMYLGTRLGGSSYSHTTYRWGYGWNYIRGYNPLSKEEVKLSEDLYGSRLSRLYKEIESKKIELKKISRLNEYRYKPVMEYSACNEKVLEHLSKNLSLPSNIQNIQERDDPYNHIVRVKLSSCNKSIEYKFNKETTSQSCKRTYEHKNILQDVFIPTSCEHSFIN